VPRTRTVVVPAVALMLILGSCSGGVKDPALDQTARDIVAMILGYNCDLLPRYLPSGAVESLSADIDAPLLAGMSNPIERLCFVLGRSGYPRSETMDVSARVETQMRAVLVLSRGDAPPASLRAPFISERAVSVVQAVGDDACSPPFASSISGLSARLAGTCLPRLLQVWGPQIGVSR